MDTAHRDPLIEDGASQLQHRGSLDQRALRRRQVATEVARQLRAHLSQQTALASPHVGFSQHYLFRVGSKLRHHMTLICDRYVGDMFGALAEFERSLIRERTQAGLAAARRAGRTGGRPPKLTDDDIEAAKAMLANPDIGVTQIAHRLGVSPATLYRYIPAARTANTPGV